MNATILHCLGIDHRRLTFKFQGLDMRLTGVEDHAAGEGDFGVRTYFMIRDLSERHSPSALSSRTSRRATSGTVTAYPTNRWHFSIKTDT